VGGNSPSSFFWVEGMRRTGVKKPKLTPTPLPRKPERSKSHPLKWWTSGTPSEHQRCWGSCIAGANSPGRDPESQKGTVLKALLHAAAGGDLPASKG